MADNKLVWVKPTRRGQRPDGIWTDEGGAPFQVAKDAVSKSWHQVLPDKEAKKLDEDKAKADAEAAAASPDGEKDAEIADLKAKLADAEAGRAIMAEAADLLQVEQGELIDTIKRLTAAAAKPASSVAGEKKKSGSGENS